MKKTIEKWVSVHPEIVGSVSIHLDVNDNEIIRVHEGEEIQPSNEDTKLHSIEMVENGKLLDRIVFNQPTQPSLF